MTRVMIAGGALAILLVLLTLATIPRAFEQGADPATSTAIIPSTMANPLTEADGEAHQGFLYGRITTVVGASYEGRLRWGGDQEAFWGDYFNGFKDHNPWTTYVPPERLPRQRRSFEIFGFEIAHWERQSNLGRFLMVRFGDIARIEAHGLNRVWVTLKSGNVFDLDRFSASDFDDGVRVWDARRGVVDLDTRLIRSIEFLSTERMDPTPDRLHGIVRTQQGDFTGFLQWDRQQGLSDDELHGHAAEGERALPFHTLHSIARRSRYSSLVRLTDGREIVLTGTHEVGHGNRGIYVDDRRYGRVLISWDAFKRVDFSRTNGSGPAYDDFPPGNPISGSVNLRDGRRIAGRLIFDLDESETTETLDAPSQGIDYTIPFGRVASIRLPNSEENDAQRARVTLQDGEQLQLERTGDLSPDNAGLLIFVDQVQRPEYVPWSEVEQVDFHSPPDGPPVGLRGR